MRLIAKLGAFVAAVPLGLVVAGETACDAPSGPTTTRVPKPTTTELPESCTYRPTQTIWAKTGCDLGCDFDTFCIADAAVVLPCGCTSARVKATTTTLCPTATGCVQCTTGWGIATITDSACASATPTAD